MEQEIKTWLFDIPNAIHEIESYFIDIPKDFNYYQNDTKTKRAIERNIEIIGEAMNRILKKTTEIEITESRKIVDVRNRIIHGYDVISDELIWSIVTSHLSILEKEVNCLLNE